MRLNKIKSVYVLAVVFFIAASFIFMKDTVIPNLSKNRISYYAEGSLRSSIDGQQNAYMFLKRWGTLNGSSKMEAVYLNKDGTVFKTATSYCIANKIAFDVSPSLKKKADTCVVFNLNNRTPEKFLGYPVLRTNSEAITESGKLFTVKVLISPSLNVEVYQEKLNPDTNITNIFQLTYVHPQSVDNSIFESLFTEMAKSPEFVSLIDSVRESLNK